MFGLVEEFILPFVLDHARPRLDGDDYRDPRAPRSSPARRPSTSTSSAASARSSRRASAAPAPSSARPRRSARAVLAHDPLAVALAILHIEWMTQRHYLESVRDDAGPRPAVQEPAPAPLDGGGAARQARHADGRGAGAKAASEDELRGARSTDYLAIGGFLDDGPRRRRSSSTSRASSGRPDRRLADGERERSAAQQHQALRWTFLGSGMTHPKLPRAAVARIAPRGRASGSTASAPPSADDRIPTEET